MDAGIRWSPHSTETDPRFLIVDVARNRLRLCQIENVDKQRVNYKQLSVRDKLPNFTAFDWSKTQESFVAVGSASGEALLLSIAQEGPQATFFHSFPIKHQRKCNSIAFSARNLLATGLDRVRNDFCMNVYDVGSGSLSGAQEPVRKLASSEQINSIKFLNGRPDILIAGVSRQCVRLYDLRDHAPSVGQYPTRQVHNIAIDPLDESYFISAGPIGDPTVSLWDQRFAGRGPTTVSDGTSSGAVLEFRPAIDNLNASAAIWSLRFSGSKRGCFGILSSVGELKVVDTTQYATRHPTASANAPTNPQGGAPWPTPYFTKATHTVQHPWYDKHNGREENARVLSFDFARYGTSSREQNAIAIRPSREVRMLKIPTGPPHIHFTAREELATWGDEFIVYEPEPKRRTIAGELGRLQTKHLDARTYVKKPLSEDDNAANRLNQLSVENGVNEVSPKMTRPAEPSYHELHENLFGFGCPGFKLDVADALKILDVHRRRCLEGYRLNSQRNKEIVSNDRWLVGLWDLVHRLEDLAADDGMVAGSVDLSYLGVADIWKNRLNPKPGARLIGASVLSEAKFANAVKGVVRAKEYPAFEGVATRFPDHRQLCLAICGWTFSKTALREASVQLFGRGEHYKAIALAVFKGHKDVALELLKYAIRETRMENIGLGAVIACDSVGADQRELCSWMADATDDPYLQALLRYFVSGDWSKVTDMPQLALADRVGVALKYLDDARLTRFIEPTTTDAVAAGNVDGLALTGLAERAVDLLQSYVARSNDLQTAVLALSASAPVYVADARWPLWKTTYFHQLQAWRAFLERTQLVALHNRRAVTRDGRALEPPTTRQVALRCHHCQQSLALRERADDAATTTNGRGPLTSPSAPPTVAPTSSSAPAPPPSAATARNPPRKGPGAAAGATCPRCGRPLPRCGICLTWLGSADPARAGGAQALLREAADAGDALARVVNFCMACGHGFHAHHARDWFARHALCPVPECRCLCGVRY